MNSSVLISIRPRWCELIASGKKTIEVRKTRPKLETPFRCYIYCTKGNQYFFHSNALMVPYRYVDDHSHNMGDELLNGKVIGSFVCDKMYGIYYSIYPHDPPVFEELGTLNRPNLMGKTCLSKIEINEYLDGKTGYGWHISALQIYDKPKELSEFKQCHKCPYGPIERCKEHEFSCDRTYALSRPPQSLVYVEELI